MNYSKLTNFNGTPCVELSAGGYVALIAYEIGSNVIRLRDITNSIEIFRFKPDTQGSEILQSAEVWGLPTLYLPNRFADGVLKTSDNVYHLPVNEKAPYNNHIHGFIHKRKHSVVENFANENCAFLKTEYIYDENDEFFEFLPVKFKAEFCFTLSDKGLEYNVTFTNMSSCMMPISLATHTTINAPFVDGGDQSDMRVSAPIKQKCELNERCLPTEELLALTDYDKEYVNGVKCPVLQNIDNDMYTVDENTLNCVIVEDIKLKKKIIYEVGAEYKFWIIWNDKGFNGYFCPEPMTAMIDAPNLSLGDETTGYCEIKPDEKYTVTQRFYTQV